MVMIRFDRGIGRNSLVCLYFELLDRQSADLGSKQLKRRPQRHMRSIWSRDDRESLCTRPEHVSKPQDGWCATRIH